MNMNQNNTTQQFIESNPVPREYKDRIPHPRFHYHGEEILHAATAAILSGKNLLLVGEKSTGKNVLAENLAAHFQRPLWNVSLHMSIDAPALLGDDSLKGGDVFFREGPITLAAKVGGFAVLDEINMAKNEALAVLHSALDYRRIIDMPGYDLIKIHPATRFIATMNYGYEGTRDLNEALAVLHSTLDYRRIIDMPGYDLIKIHPATRFIATMNEGYEGTRDLNEALLSRFVVLKMPAMAERDLKQLIEETYPNLKPAFLSDLARLVADMDKKAAANEIARHAVDIRGLFDALDLVNEGLELNDALAMTLANKLFDPFEEELLADLFKARFKDRLYLADLTNQP